MITTDAGVVKLVDAGDSKSPGPCAHVGSSPTSGTNGFSFFLSSVFLVIPFFYSQEAASS